MANVRTVNRVNGIDLNVLKETVGAIQKNPSLGQSHFRVHNRWVGANHNWTTITDFYVAGEDRMHKQQFDLHADEPPLLSGNDQYPNPVEHLLNALVSCVTTSLIAHAAVREIDIEELESQVEGDIDLRGFLGLDPNVPKGYSNIRINFKVKTNEKDVNKLHDLAAYSPVYNTLTNGCKVDMNIEYK